MIVLAAKAPKYLLLSFTKKNATGSRSEPVELSAHKTNLSKRCFNIILAPTLRATKLFFLFKSFDHIFMHLSLPHACYMCSQSRIPLFQNRSNISWCAQNVNRSNISLCAQNVNRSNISRCAQNMNGSNISWCAQNVNRSNISWCAQNVNRSNISLCAQNVNRINISWCAQNVNLHIMCSFSAWSFYVLSPKSKYF